MARGSGPGEEGPGTHRGWSTHAVEAATQAARSRRQPREFLREAEEGLAVRIRCPLPRTPHVFEEQLRWPLDNQPWEPGLRWVPNYSSVEEHVEFAKTKFEEDIAEG